MQATFEDVKLLDQTRDTLGLNLQEDKPRPCFETIRGRWTVKGYSIRALMKRILVLLFVLLCFYVLVWLPVQSTRGFQETFRSSVQVVSADQRQRLIQTYEDKLSRYMARSIDSCGVAAPHIRVYQQYMLMRVDSKLVDMFNPRFGVLNPSSTNYTFEETSLLCHNTSSLSIQRSVAIHATWDSPTGAQVERDLYGKEAVCFQHMMDTFAGKWPCRDEGSQLMIPYMYNVLNPHEHEL